MFSSERPGSDYKLKKSRTSPSIDAVVFAGGGTRCFWQVGFWDAISGMMELQPKRVAAASAGAAMACVVFSGKTKETLERFKEATARNRRNVYLSNFFGGDPVFPHYGMYRKAILEAVDTSALRILHEGPDIRVLLSLPPRRMGARCAAVVGILGYMAERYLKDPVHPSFGRHLGFSPRVVSVRECVTVDELADLILASSCTPPLTPLLTWRGESVLDGGLVDNVPVGILGGSGGNTLVLLTRTYDTNRIPPVPNMTYVQPSRPISISKWDYTNPAGLQEVFDLGRSDGEAFCRGRGLRP